MPGWTRPAGWHATLVGRPIEFDPQTCTIPGDEEADRAIRPPHREGWEV